MKQTTYQSLSDQKGDNKFNMFHSASLTYNIICVSVNIVLSFLSLLDSLAPVFSQSREVKFKPVCNSYTLTIAFLKEDLYFPVNH